MAAGSHHVLHVHDWAGGGPGDGAIAEADLAARRDAGVRDGDAGVQAAVAPDRLSAHDRQQLGVPPPGRHADFGQHGSGLAGPLRSVVGQGCGQLRLSHRQTSVRGTSGTRRDCEGDEAGGDQQSLWRMEARQLAGAGRARSRAGGASPGLGLANRHGGRGQFPSP